MHILICKFRVIPRCKKKKNKKNNESKIKTNKKQTDFDFVELCKSMMSFHGCIIKQTELYGHDVEG